MSPEREELDKLIRRKGSEQETKALLESLSDAQQRFKVLAERLQNGQTALFQAVEEKSLDVSVLESSAIDTFPTD